MLMMMTDLGTVHKTNPTCHTNDFCEDNGPGLLGPGQLSFPSTYPYRSILGLQFAFGFVYKPKVLH